MPKPGDIIGFNEMISIEGKMLQHGMNYRVRPTHSVFLMAQHKNAPYPDRLSADGKRLAYIGHDAHGDPRKTEIDQPLITHTGALTPNGKFFQAAQRGKKGGGMEAVRVYEKLKPGIWVFNGIFRLLDARQESDGRRKVWVFELELVETADLLPDVEEREDVSPGRLIPTEVKLAVWKRDKGRCVQCGATTDLHFDHELPFSKGGTSRMVRNIQLLCATCNLKKGSKVQ